MKNAANAQNSVMFFNPSTGDIRMDFETFVKRLSEDACNELRNEGIDITAEEHRTISKPGTQYEGVGFTLGSDDSVKMGPCLNMSEIYEEYSSGRDYDDLFAAVVEVLKSSLTPPNCFNVEELRDYNKVKEHLYLQVVSSKDPSLKEFAHKNLFHDIEVIYRIMIEEDENINTSAIVSNRSLEDWGISLEQLHEDALSATMKNYGLCFGSIFETLKKMGAVPPFMDESDFESQMPIVVASNEKGCLGAAVLSYPDFFEKAEEVMGGSFWILPSSIHEVLMVPDTGDDGMAEMLLEMVTMVNASGAVAPQDVLTDNAYYFDSERKTLVTAESYAAEHDDSNEDEQLY